MRRVQDFGAATDAILALVIFHDLEICRSWDRRGEMGSDKP